VTPLAELLLAHRREGTPPPSIAIGDEGTVIVSPWTSGGLTLKVRDDDKPEQIASLNMADDGAIRQLRDLLTAMLDVKAEVESSRRAKPVAAE